MNRPTKMTAATTTITGRRGWPRSGRLKCKMQAKVRATSMRQERNDQVSPSKKYCGHRVLSLLENEAEATMKLLRLMRSHFRFGCGPTFSKHPKVVLFSLLMAVILVLLSPPHLISASTSPISHTTAATTTISGSGATRAVTSSSSSLAAATTGGHSEQHSRQSSSRLIRDQVSTKTRSSKDRDKQTREVEVGTTIKTIANKRHKKKAIESLLVRQLSDLIMNNEPEVIEQKLTSQQISGQLAAETNRLLMLATTTAAANNNGRPPTRTFKLVRKPRDQVDNEDDQFSLLPASSSSLLLDQLGPEESDTADYLDSPSPFSTLAQIVTEKTSLISPTGSPRTIQQTTKRITTSKKRRHMLNSEQDSQQEAVTATPQANSGDINSEPQADDPAGISASGMSNSGGPSDEFLQEQQQQQQSQDEQMQTVTCSPDYEDQMVMMDRDEGASMVAMNDLSVNGQNLTAEQRQQLLNGASDLTGSLFNNNNNGSNGNSNSLSQMGMSAHQPQQMCVPAGSRMIEVITKVITPILFTIIIIVGLLGNIIVMLVILEDRQVERELTPTNLLILDLSLADLSFIIFCIPFTGWDYAVGHWVFGAVWCKFNQYLIVVCALSSIYTLVLMSCDRFMAIVYPIECISYRTSKNMLHAIVIKWIVILLIALPTIPMHGLVDSPLGPDQYNCRFLSDQFNPLHFQFIFFITSYFLPLVLIFFLYLSLLRRLWCGQKPHGHKESTKMLESKKKVTWLVASIVLVFAACWFPIQIMLILMRLKTHKITATYVAVQVFAHTLGYMNSCVNPIVYAFASDTFNQSFKKSRLGRLCLTYLCCQPPSVHQSLNGQGHQAVAGNHSTNHFTTHLSGATNGHNHQHATSSNIVESHHHHLLATGNTVAGGRARSSLQIMSTTTTTTTTNTNSSATGQEQAVRANRSLSHIFSPPQVAASNAGARSRLDVDDDDDDDENGPDERVTSCSVGPASKLFAQQRPVSCSPQPLPLEPRDRPQIKSPPPPSPMQMQMPSVGQLRTLATSSSASQLQQHSGGEATGGGPGGQVVAKQQLVARMVQSSQLVSHDCQPSEHELCRMD